MDTSLSNLSVVACSCSPVDSAACVVVVSDVLLESVAVVSGALLPHPVVKIIDIAIHSAADFAIKPFLLMKIPPNMFYM